MTTSLIRPLWTPISTLLLDVTTTSNAQAGSATPPPEKTESSWTSWLNPLTALPVVLPAAGYGLYRLFAPRPVQPPLLKNVAQPVRTYERDRPTVEFLIANDVTITVTEDGGVSVQDREKGPDAKKYALKPNDGFIQGDYAFTLKNDGGLYLEGYQFKSGVAYLDTAAQKAKPFIVPLRSTEAGTMDLIQAKYDSLTVTEIEIPDASFRAAKTEVNIDLKSLSLRPQERGDLTKGRQNRPEVKAYEGKTLEFEGRKDVEKTQKIRIK